MGAIARRPAAPALAPGTRARTRVHARARARTKSRARTRPGVHASSWATTSAGARSNADTALRPHFAADAGADVHLDIGTDVRTTLMAAVIRPTQPRIDRRQIGAMAEDVAAAYLQAQGVQLLFRNYRRRLGELDLVARQGDVLLIVEVRTRSSAAYGGAAASVDGLKRRRIVRAAQQLLQQHKDLSKLRARFDVIVVCDLSAASPRVEWLRGAFDA